MKVLFLASTADKSGGSFHSLLGIASELKRQGLIEPFVVLPRHGNVEELLSRNEIEYHVFPSFGGEWPLGAPKPFRQRLSHFRQRLTNHKAIVGISRFAKLKGIDIIHINTSADEIGFYVAKRSRLPFVWHIREFMEEDHHIEFYHKRRTYSHMAKANAIITVSNALKQRYQSILPKANICMIHNGIDKDRFFMPRSFAKKERMQIAAVGRISRLKGHYDLVGAFEKIIREDKIDASLVFGGAFGEELETIVKQKGLQPYISFSGFLDHPETLLAQSDILVSSSPWEAFGRVTAEGMLAGCCVIGVNNGGTKDLITNGETGLLYEVGDIEGLRLALKEALLNPENTHILAVAGQKYAYDHFGQEHCASNIYAVYRKVLAR